MVGETLGEVCRYTENLRNYLYICITIRFYVPFQSEKIYPFANRVLSRIITAET